MKGMGYFQNLRNFLDSLGNFGGYFLGFFKKIFLEEFFEGKFLGGIFWEDFLGGIFWEEFLGGFFQSNSLGGMLCLCWFVKILIFVKILSQWRRKDGKKFRSLEVQRKLIALKKTQ